jgi:hypothetical protein
MRPTPSQETLLEQIATIGASGEQIADGKAALGAWNLALKSLSEACMDAKADG